MKLTPKQKEIIDKAIELEHGPVADTLQFQDDAILRYILFSISYINQPVSHSFLPVLH